MNLLDQNYKTLINDLKSKIQTAHIKAHLAVNRELILLYWNIGKRILEQKEKLGWGSKVIERISKDLRQKFPGMKGLSARNLVYMQTFARKFNNFEFTQQSAAQLPWFHICTLLDKAPNETSRIWYIQKTIENGWSRAVLEHQISTNLHERQGAAITNFKETLPALQSDLAHELVKDPYNFEFLDIDDKSKERELHKSLLNNIRDFLLELGAGFAFMGSEYKLKLEDDEYFLDLLFYHVKLKSYVIIELKTGKFLPEHSGKMNFYVNLVNDFVKQEGDRPTIGIILCRDKKKIVAEYALKGVGSPVDVSSYTLTKALPKELVSKLPSPEEFQKRLEETQSNTETKEEKVAS